MMTFRRLINNKKCKSKNGDAFHSVITDETEHGGPEWISKNRWFCISVFLFCFKKFLYHQLALCIHSWCTTDVTKLERMRHACAYACMWRSAYTRERSHPPFCAYTLPWIFCIVVHVFVYCYRHCYFVCMIWMCSLLFLFVRVTCTRACIRAWLCRSFVAVGWIHNHNVHDHWCN